MNKTVLLAVGLGVLLLIAGIVTGIMWTDMGDVQLSLHGIVAMVLGVVLALALGIGLMFLVFYSAKHGHDDQAGR